MNEPKNNPIRPPIGSDISLEETIRLLPGITDITNMVSGTETEHHQLERYRLLIENYNAVSFEYNIASDALGFDFWWHDGRQHIMLVEHFIENLPNSRLITADSRHVISDAFAVLSAKKARMKIQLQADIFSGGVRWWNAHMISLTDEDGCVYSIVGLLQDVQDEHEQESTRSDLEASLRRKAEIDELTGIYNKSTAQDKIKELLAAQEPGMHSALLILDVDNFKQINDTMGHLYGDSFLKEAAGVIKKCFREDDILGRFGGDEFVVFIAQHGDKRLVERKSRQILRGFNKIQVEGIEQISCSIGAVIISSDMTDYYTVFKQADSALYESKRSGKNRYTLFNQNSSMLGAGKVEHTAMDIAQRVPHDRESISENVLNVLLSSSNTAGAIHKMLKAAVDSFRLSRAFLCERDYNGIMRVTGDYISPEIPEDDKNALTAADRMSGYFSELPEHFSLGDLYYSRSGSGLVKSYISCAIRDGAELFGFIVFEQTVADRFLTQEQVESLCFVTNLMGLYLQKQRASESFPDFVSAELLSINDWSVPSLLVSPERMAIAAVNKAARQALSCARGDACLNTLCPDGGAGDCEHCILTGALNGTHGAEQSVRGVTVSAEIVYVGGKTMLGVFAAGCAPGEE